MGGGGKGWGREKAVYKYYSGVSHEKYLNKKHGSKGKTDRQLSGGKFIQVR